MYPWYEVKEVKNIEQFKFPTEGKSHFEHKEKLILPNLTSSFSGTALLLITRGTPSEVFQRLNRIAELSGADELTIVLSHAVDTNPSLYRTFKGVIKTVQRLKSNVYIKYIPNSGRSPSEIPHYKFVLDKIFSQHGYSKVIVVEDEAELSRDILLFYDKTSKLLDTDPSLFCVSGWNEYSLPQFNLDPVRLLRTHRFPGLTYMITAKFWEEIRKKALPHPGLSMNEWLRMSSINQNRECIIPELSRARSWNSANKNIRIMTYPNLDSKAEIILNLGDLNYLYKDNYEQMIRQMVEKATLLELNYLNIKKIPPSEPNNEKIYLLPFLWENFSRIISKFGVTTPTIRSHHHHTVILRYKNNIFILANARKSPYVPEIARVKPNQKLIIHPGSQGQSCKYTCTMLEKECTQSEFELINDCQILKKHFPCEKGCISGIGSDIPNYVSGIGDRSFGYCLVSEDVPLCASRHENTERLCPCI